MRISAQLLHAPSDTHLWAESYDRDLRDILTLQSEVSRAIAAEIKAKVSPQEHGQLKQVRPVVPEAYEAYLMGRHYWNKRTPEGLQKGTEYFQQAIEQDPTYAAPYAGLADMAASAGFWGFWPPAQASLKAQAAARKSLAIEENGEAHAALGWAILLYDYDYPAAERELQRSIALYPGYAPAFLWYGHCLICSGRLQEGLELNRQALRLDPLSLIAHVCYAAAVWMARDFDRCIDDCRRALEIDPNYMGLHWMLANALQSKGDHEQAIRVRQRGLEVAPEAVICLAELANSYAAGGIRSEALKLLEQLHELRRQKYVMAYLLAGIYCSLNDKEEAFHWLDQALEERSSHLAYVNVDPRLDSLRPDPRFHDLLRRMKPEQ